MKRVFLVLVGGLAVAIAGSSSVRTAAPEPTAAPAAVPTFAKDVAPIVFNHCTSCHRPGEVAPMSLHVLRRRAAVGARHQVQGRGA